MNQSIDRKGTAIERTTLSRPMSLLLKGDLIGEGVSIFGYGCGRGGDVRILRSPGFDVSGWDPDYRPNDDRHPADIVNFGYVPNVIKSERDRDQALTYV